MTRNALLLSVLLIEIVTAGWFLFGRAATCQPPVPNFEGYPAYTVTRVTEAMDSVRADNAMDWRGLADTFFGAGFYPEAEACYRQAVALSANNPQLRYDWAFCLSSIGDLTGSDTEFQASLKLGHSHPNACWYFLGMNALRDQRRSDAAAAFEQSRDLDVSRLELAELAVDNEDFRLAGSLLKPLAEEYPNAWRVHHLLATVASGLKDSKSAEEHRALADVLSETITGPWQSKVARMQKLAMNLSVEHQVEELLKTMSTPQGVARARGAAHAANSKAWNPLLEDFLSDIDIFSGDADSQLQRLQLVIDRDGINAYRAARLGFALLGLQRMNEAKSLFKIGIRLHTGGKGQECIDMSRALGEILNNQGRTEEANHYEAFAEFLTGTAMLDDLAVAEAAKAFQRAVEIDRTSARYWFWLGRSQQLLGQDEAAVAAFDSCLKLNPHHERAAVCRSVLTDSK